MARIPVPQIQIFPGTFLSVASKKKIRKRFVVAEKEKKEMKGNGSCVREEARRRANEGRIATNVIFISSPRRGQRGHQRTGDE